MERRRFSIMPEKVRIPKTLTELHEQEDAEAEVVYENKKSKPREKLVQKNK
jgi:hypothetical protein